MKYSETEQILKKEGCHWLHDGANHPIWYRPITKKTFPLSFHRSEEVRIGTLKSISKRSGVKL